MRGRPYFPRISVSCNIDLEADPDRRLAEGRCAGAVGREVCRVGGLRDVEERLGNSSREEATAEIGR